MGVNKKVVYDEEWMELIKEARDLGIDYHDVRVFLQQTENKDGKSVLKNEDITVPGRTRRGSHEQRSVHEKYVSSGETTQRRDSQALFPGFFENPL
ncbi:Anti-repressor SinI [Evansella caseinilytica]|uniref:Anti-repressor SinI n=1 Tax=Evansella caseinilytica TaxID=1503961 RepID=A0A1H3GTK9_9BACI|nr:anti-repressor SinI family protein [Evansella caseinilytica]SDY05679.1 Anti-repressor SinI [Evansella caseinilytica]